MNDINTRLDVGRITATVTLRIGWGIEIRSERSVGWPIEARGEAKMFWPVCDRRKADQQARTIRRIHGADAHVVPVLTMDPITLPARFLKQKAAKGAKEARR